MVELVRSERTMTDIRPAILIVDDEPDNLEALERVFRKKYHVHKALSGNEALDILRTHSDIPLLLSDQRMPQMTGVEFLKQSIQIQPHAIRFLLTGYADFDSIIEAVNEARIYRYMNKPWDPVDLLATIDRGLERYKIDRELALKTQELQKAYNDLKGLDVAKNKFMILINHELRTPLTTILSFADLLKESQMTEEQHLCLTRIQRSGDRLKAIIEDVLLVMQGETGALPVQKQKLSLSQLLNQISPDLKRQLSQKSQPILTDLRQSEAFADPKYLLQILNRLIHNASKFGRENEAIRIHTRTLGNQMEFKITNVGPKIRVELINKILSPFLLDEEVMHHSSGMGLGLSVCQTLIRAHKGSLSIKNLDQGVEVCFLLPMET